MIVNLQKKKKILNSYMKMKLLLYLDSQDLHIAKLVNLTTYYP